MNVLVVEPEKKEAQKLVRVLRLVDPTIQVVETLDSLARLLLWLNEHPHPDLVLINQSKLPKLAPANPAVLARLVLHTRQLHFTYLAFRSNTIIQLHEVPAFPKPRAAGLVLDPLTSDPAEGPFSPGGRAAFKHRFFVESGKRFLSVPVKDIAYFVSDGRFVYLTTHTGNRYIVHYRMDELELLLDPAAFYRPNRSYIISVDAIEQIHPYFGARFKIRLKPSTQEEILVSRNRALGFRKWLGD